MAQYGRVQEIGSKKKAVSFDFKFGEASVGTYNTIAVCRKGDELSFRNVISEFYLKTFRNAADL